MVIEWGGQGTTPGDDGHRDWTIAQWYIEKTGVEQVISMISSEKGEQQRVTWVVGPRA